MLCDMSALSGFGMSMLTTLQNSGGNGGVNSDIGGVCDGGVDCHGTSGYPYIPLLLPLA